MKRTHLLIAGVVVAAIAIFFVVRGGGQDGADQDENARRGGDEGPIAPERRQVAMSQGGGEQAQALMDDDPEGELRLEGQVIDANDDPVEGARVTISSNPPRQVMTDASGAFGFDKLVGRPYELVARATEGVAGPVTARLTAESDPVILRLKPASAVEVTVISAVDRTPISGATVELRDLEVQTESTDGDGVARLANVVPGGYSLAAHAPGYAKSHAWVRVPAGQDVTAVTTLSLRKGAPVSGRVISPDGAPVEGARVTYSGASDWSQQAHDRHDAVVSDKDGRYVIDALPGGTFRFVARHKDYAESSSELVTLDGITEKSGVDIRLDRAATLTGKVVDTGGEGMASARVRVVVTVAGMRWDQPRQAYSDSTGAFEIGGLPQKPLQVVAVHEVASSQIREVDLSGKDTGEIELVLDVEGVIAGTVVDTTGEPIEGASVVAWPDFSSPGGRRAARQDMRMRGGNQDLTDAGGRFRISGLEDGEYNLRATPPGIGSSWRDLMNREAVDARVGATDVKIVLPADGGVKGKVAFADGTVPEVFTVSTGMRGGTPFSSKKGEFQLDALAPRTYSIKVTGPGFDAKTVADVEVKEGEVADIGTVTVAKGRSITGRVTRDGRAVAGATVVAGRRMFGNGTSAQASFGGPGFGGGNKEATTDDNGNFSLNGVGPSDLMVVAEHESEGRSQTYAIRMTRDSVHGLELALQPYSSLAGKVTSGGKPAEGVRVSAVSQSAPSMIFGVATGADGSYRFDRLAPDSYKVSALPGGGNPMGGMSFYSKVVNVVAGETARLDLSIDEGNVTLTVTVKPTNQDSINFAFLQHTEGEITARTARELELVMAQVPAGSSGFKMSIRGMAVELENLRPGVHTVCAVPYPTDVTGMADTMAYGEREGDNLKVFCETVQVGAETAQSLDLEVEVPAFVPAPAGG